MNTNTSTELNEAINAIYKIDPKWCYQLRVAIRSAQDEREIWKRIDDAKGSQNPTRKRAHSAVSVTAAKMLADTEASR